MNQFFFRAPLSIKLIVSWIKLIEEAIFNLFALEISSIISTLRELSVITYSLD